MEMKAAFAFHSAGAVPVRERPSFFEGRYFSRLSCSPAVSSGSGSAPVAGSVRTR